MWPFLDGCVRQFIQPLWTLVSSSVKWGYNNIFLDYCCITWVNTCKVFRNSKLVCSVSLTSPESRQYGPAERWLAASVALGKLMTSLCFRVLDYQMSRLKWKSMWQIKCLINVILLSYYYLKYYQHLKISTTLFPNILCFPLLLVILLPQFEI